MTDAMTVYLSLGSNLDQRLQILQQAIVMLGKDVGPVSAISNVYESPSWGFEGNDFLNACIKIETFEDPKDLLAKIHSIEKKMGRTRNLYDIGYQSRKIDIDILYYGFQVIQTEEMTIPHPKIPDRRFVLRPLADIAPQLYHPILKKDTRNLLQACKDKNIPKKLDTTLYLNREALFTQMQFIAIEGNIGAGKTSLAKKISEDFNAKLVLERFADNPFLPNFYKDQSRYAFPLEMSFLADRYQQFNDDTSQYDLFKNFMVSDYDIFKSIIFAKITLQSQEFDLYRKIFNVMYKEVKKPQIYVFLYQTTERLLENIKKRGRVYEQDIKPRYLEKINRGYFDYLKGFPELNSLVIDASEIDFLEHSKDYETILRTMQDYVIGNSN